MKLVLALVCLVVAAVSMDGAEGAKTDCKDWCPKILATWEKKCEWQNGKFCGGCKECKTLPATTTTADGLVCNDHCNKNLKTPWSKKCNEGRKYCGGCDECKKLTATTTTADGLVCNDH